MVLSAEGDCCTRAAVCARSALHVWQAVVGTAQQICTLVITAYSPPQDSRCNRAAAHRPTSSGMCFNGALLSCAGIGSDHVDLEAAAERNLTVAECTGAAGF
jgi:hypothetical protein